MEKMELSEALKANASVLEELMPIANLGSKGLLRKGVLSPILVCNKDSVQEGLLGINDTWYKRRFGEITDFNEANNTGYMFVDKTQSLDNKPNTSSNYGFLETIAINEVTIKQTFVDFQSRFFIRICNCLLYTSDAADE